MIEIPTEREQNNEELKGPRHRCKRCRGTGQVPGIKKTLNMGKGMGSQYGTCPECDGLGYLYEPPIDPRVTKLSKY